MEFEKMLKLLRCPRTGSRLRHQGDSLISEAGEIYPLIDGKPILVREILPMHTTRPDARIVSQNQGIFEAPQHLKGHGAVVIHLGSGNVPSPDEEVISLDILPTANVDIIAEAECLPFADGTIDHITSGAVFEHLYDPMMAIKEVRRVLKEGGSFYIDTAFMQGYHGFPSHYFNLTPQACETFLVDDFILHASTNMGPGTVFHPVVTSLSRLLEQIPEKNRARVLNKTVGAFISEMNAGVPPDFCGYISEMTMRSLAANYIVAGVKPAGYDLKRKTIVSEIGPESWASLKRAYYSGRTSIVAHHSEIEYYRMRAIEDYGVSVDAVVDVVPNLNVMLQDCKVTDPMNIWEWTQKSEALTREAQLLIALRDKWITKFLTAKEISEQTEVTDGQNLGSRALEG